MKRQLSIALILILILQLTACGLNSEEKKTGTVYLKNCIDNSDIEINVDADKTYFANGFTLAFQSEMSIEDMKTSLAEKNPDYTFEVIDERQILMKSDGKCPYALFSKNVVDSDFNPIHNVYVIVSESAVGNRNNAKICYPYHLTKTYFILKSDNDTYSLDANLSDSFYSTVDMQDAQNAMGNLVTFYRECGYSVEHEGTNSDGGVIYITPNVKNTPTYHVLVMRSGDKCAIQYGTAPVAYELKAKEVVDKYIIALNSKKAEDYLSCFEKIDSSSVDVFLNNVKSCRLNHVETLWMDQANNEYIFKLDYKLISEEDKQMGSYGTGEFDIVEYWTIKTDDADAVIKGKFSNIGDSIRQLKNYEEFKKNENTLVDWLFSITPAN